MKMKNALAVILSVGSLMVGSCEQERAVPTPALGHRDTQVSTDAHQPTKGLEQLKASPAYRWGTAYLKRVEQVLAERSSKTPRENDR